MAGRELAMEKANEIRRLKALGHSERQIIKILHVSRKTVQKYLAQPADGVQTSSAAPLTEATWADRLDWAAVIAEVKKGVPIQILWEELAQQNKVCVGYAGFWKQFRRRCPDIEPTMVRTFGPGERIEIDYCDGIDLFDPITGESQPTQLFVGVLCHSRYTFAEFTLTQRSEDFLLSHVKMFEFFGGVSQIVTPDNLKSAVARAHRYDPVINPAYTRLAEHYEFAVVPARARRPTDKALVERTIQIFQRWFFMRVRKHRFRNLAELNKSLREHLEAFNNRIHRIFGKSRRDLFERERASLLPLSEKRYEIAIHHRAKLHADCHVVFEKNYYSAPFELRGEELDLWISAGMVEIYHVGSRVAAHPRKPGYRGMFVTEKKHYPPQHQAYYDATPQYLRDQAAKVGPKTAQMICELLSGPFPLQYVRRAQGIVRLGDKYGAERLETAVDRALLHNQRTYQAIEKLVRFTACKLAGQTQEPIKRGENQHLRGDDLFH